MMTRLKIRLLAPALLALSVLVAPAAPAQAQADAARFPARAVRIVVPFPPGGSTEPNKGGAPAGQAVLAGEVECMMMNVVEATPLLQAGRLRALAVTSRERASQLPAVPTLHETVSPGVDSSVWQGVLVPAGTSPAVVDKINRGWRGAIESADIRDRLEGMGMKLAAGTPAEFDAFLKAEFAQWAQVAKAGNIKAE